MLKNDKEQIKLKELNSQVFDNRFKNSILYSLIFLIFNIYLVFQFTFLFYTNTNFSLIIFYLSISCFTLFIVFFMKAISIYESNKNKVFGKKVYKTQSNFFHRFLSLLEEFPYAKNYTGKRKYIINTLGWGILIYFFIVGCLMRNMFELQSPLSIGEHFFGIAYYVFVFALGCLMTYYFTKYNLSKIIKLLLFAFPIMIQIPIIVDYLMLGFDTLPAYAISTRWEDIIIAFNSFLLAPELQAYLCHLGHPMMFLVLLILNGMYIFTRNYYPSNGNRSELSISIFKTALAIIAFYIFFQISAAIYELTYMTLDFFYLNRNRIYSDIYTILLYSSVFLLGWLKIHLEESKKSKYKKKLLMITPASNFLTLTDYIEWLNKTEKKYKSRYTLKLGILFILYLVFHIFFALVIVPIQFSY